MDSDAPAREDAMKTDVEGSASTGDVSSSLLLADDHPLALLDEDWHRSVLNDLAWPTTDWAIDWEAHALVGADEPSDARSLGQNAVVAVGIDASDGNGQLAWGHGRSPEQDGEAERGEATAAPPLEREPHPETANLQRRRSYRVKKKNELLELRATAKALALEVAEMKARHNHHDTSDRLGVGWRGVALRQRKRRAKAEGVNRELRELLRHRHALSLQAIDSLRGAAVGMAALAALQQSRPAMQLDGWDIHLVEVFRHELAGRYARADSVLASCEMPSVGPENAYSLRCSRRWDHAAGCEIVELTEAHFVPFAFPNAALALKKALPSLHGKECVPAILQLPDSEHATASKFQFSNGNTRRDDTSGQATAARYECLSVSNVFVEPDRVVFVWRAVMTDCDVPSNSFSEEGWGTAKAMFVVTDGPPAGTVFEFYTRLRSHQSPLIRNTDAVAKYLKQVTLAATEDAEELTQAIENALMDEMAALSVCTNSK